MCPVGVRANRVDAFAARIRHEVAGGVIGESRDPSVSERSRDDAALRVNAKTRALPIAITMRGDRASFVVVEAVLPGDERVVRVRVGEHRDPAERVPRVGVRLALGIGNRPYVERVIGGYELAAARTGRDALTIQRIVLDHARRAAGNGRGCGAAVAIVPI